MLKSNPMPNSMPYVPPTKQRANPKIAGLRLKPGDRVTIVTPGAGGYGAPAERDAALRAHDVRDGKVSAR